MAGLVPAIYVVVQLYVVRVCRYARTLRRVRGKILGLLTFNRVDGRDKPGHDGSVEFDYFVANKCG